jgi:ubiquinone/menaquinone biosynthesis C-methylase UbiE
VNVHIRRDVAAYGIPNPRLLPLLGWLNVSDPISFLKHALAVLARAIHVRPLLIQNGSSGIGRPVRTALGRVLEFEAMAAIEPRSYKQLDIEYHRTTAAQYDHHVTRRFHFYHVYSLHPWARSLVSRYSDPLVLDIGTGTGVVACTMAQFGCRVRAIDHSPEMLAIATSHAADAGLSSRIEFLTGDSEQLQFDDASFDAVTIQGMLHHLPTIEPTLREAVRVLRPGGELYVSEPCIEGTPVSKFVNGISTGLRRLIHAKAEAQPSEHEAPIEGPRLISLLRSLELETRAEYLVNLNLMRFAPAFLRIYITLLCSVPTRRTRGDLVFVIAKKVC